MLYEDLKDPSFSNTSVTLTPCICTAVMFVLMTGSEKYQDELLSSGKHFMQKVLKPAR